MTAPCFEFPCQRLRVAASVIEDIAAVHAIAASVILAVFGAGVVVGWAMPRARR